MSLFPNIQLYDAVVQTNEKTRISADKSYVSKDESALTSVEVNPEVGIANYIEVFDSDQRQWFLDYEYASSGTKTVSVRIDNGSGPSSITGSIEVLTPSSDKLFSTDQDLVAEESDILQWIPEWKTSFNHIHRRAQERMFAWLDEKGYTDVYAEKFTKEDVVDTEELNEWSKYMVLRMIFNQLSNQVDDIFDRKSKYYESKEINARKRYVLRIDIDADGVVDTFEDMQMNTGRVFRK